MMRQFARVLMPNRLRHSIGNLFQNINRHIFKHTSRLSDVDMWKKRARQYGYRAVLNIGHSDEEIETVTEMQKEKIFPFLKKELKSFEKKTLDFGCGTGRFAPDLAELTKGNVIGVDLIPDFLRMAPKHENVEYRLIEENVIPVSDESIDIVWICLVLGGITEKHALNNVVVEVDRVLKNGGLITLIENTTDVKDGEYWKFRSVEFYQSLFGFAKMEHFSDYYDLGERISIIGGRKDV